MSYLYWTDHRRPAAYQAPEPSNNGSISNHFDRFARYGYNPSLEYRNQHTYLAQRRDRVAYDPAIHGQYAEAYYPQTSSTRPADSQNGRHMDRHGFDYQQYDSNQNDDSEGSSTAAVVGSRAPQSFLTPPSVYHHPHNTAQIGDPSTQAIHSQYQHEPLMNHSVPYDWTARTTSGGYRGPPYQYGGQTPMYPNTSLMPTSYHASQAWANRPPAYVCLSAGNAKPILRMHTADVHPKRARPAVERQRPVPCRIPALPTAAAAKRPAKSLGHRHRPSPISASEQQRDHGEPNAHRARSNEAAQDEPPPPRKREGGGKVKLAGEGRAEGRLG